MTVKMPTTQLRTIMCVAASLQVVMITHAGPQIVWLIVKVMKTNAVSSHASVAVPKASSSCCGVETWFKRELLRCCIVMTTMTH